jgi:hypothetical protein
LRKAVDLEETMPGTTSIATTTSSAASTTSTTAPRIRIAGRMGGTFSDRRMTARHPPWVMHPHPAPDDVRAG